MRTKYRDVPMGIDSTRLGWMGVLRWKAWIRLGCPGDEQGVSVAHGHRHLAASNGNGGKHRIVRRAGVLESSSLPFADVHGNHLLMGSGYRKSVFDREVP
ncbi:unnamed protein product [Arabidopsis halleri]